MTTCNASWPVSWGVAQCDKELGGHTMHVARNPENPEETSAMTDAVWQDRYSLTESMVDTAETEAVEVETSVGESGESLLPVGEDPDLTYDDESPVVPVIMRDEFTKREDVHSSEVMFDEHTDDDAR